MAKELHSKEKHFKHQKEMIHYCFHQLNSTNISLCMYMYFFENGIAMKSDVWIFS